MSGRDSGGASTHAGAIPKTMRAGVYREKGIVRVEEVPVPEVGDGEVLIKVAACGVCGTDIKKDLLSVCGAAANFGTRIGGTVVAVGAALRNGNWATG